MGQVAKSPGFSCDGNKGAIVEDKGATLSAVFQLAGIVAAGLVLPSALLDWAFGTELLSALPQAVLAAFACALIVGVARKW
jgi:hypothetical protein